MEEEKKKSKWLSSFSNEMSTITGSSITVVSAFIIVILWATTGPFVGFCATWMQVMSTGITIITFLMVFVIQHAQNKDTMALQLKLNELIAATQGASNRVLNIEDMTGAELKVLKKFYSKLSDLSESEENFGAAHSIDEAEKNEAFKESPPAATDEG